MRSDAKINWSKSERISRTAEIQVNAPVADAFPLFGPIREKEWASGWNPEVIYASSPLVEQKMIFRTGSANEIYTWIVGRYEPEHCLVEYIVYTELRIWFITVSCRSAGPGTIVSVTYTYTGLTEEGSARNQKAMDEMFRHDLKDWEEALAHYLLTGETLRPELASFT